jgi:predicted nucleotidyltransferase
MHRTSEFLAEALEPRLRASRPYVQECFEQASEVIIFGSMSAGLERPDSDIDVLCVAGCNYKLKTDLLDLIVVPSGVTKSRAWLESELATHVAQYGTWIKGTPRWKNDARIGQKAVNDKRRRLSAFMRSLQNSWAKLEECFRLKYSTKLRRETQRLILLERGIPVPPTRILDHSWASMSTQPHNVVDRLRQFAPRSSAPFLADLFARIDA